MKTADACPECGSKALYETRNDVWSRDLHGRSDILPGLGGIFAAGTLSVLVCRDCGLMRLYASRQACGALDSSSSWARVVVA